MKRIYLILVLAVISCFNAWSQGKIRVIMDNDFAGDPDGLYALAHLVESPSIDVRAIIGSHLHEKENWAEPGQPSATSSVKCANKVLQALGKNKEYRVV